MVSEATFIAAIVAIVAAVPPTIAAVAAYVQSKAAVISANHAASASQANLVKAEGLVTQVKEVHTLTNSNLSAVKAELATAQQRIADLVEVVADLKAERHKAALALALSTPGIPAPRPARATDAVPTAKPPAPPDVDAHTPEGPPHP